MLPTSVALLLGLLGASLGGGHAQINFLKLGRVTEKEAEVTLERELAAAAQATPNGRLQKIEDTMRSMYASLPKNGEGHLEHDAVRYALHRFFVHRYGWFIRGLEPGHNAQHRASSGEGEDAEWVPSFLQDILERHLGNHGASLEQLAALAAALEDLVQREAVSRLEEAYNIHEHTVGESLDEEAASEIISTYYVSFLLAGNFSARSPWEAASKKQVFASRYDGWLEAEQWLRDLSSKHMKPNEENAMSFEATTRLVKSIGEEYYRFNDLECNDLKTTLRSIERKPGRVRLSSFYSKGLYSHWRFTEKADYLRSLGALDESDSKHPSVIIANYAMARPNCLDSSNLYAICCRNECEDLMGHLEKEIGGATATQEQIAGLISNLPSATVQAPRNFSTTLMTRLGEVAAQNGNRVPLHGRLFAQWMHHAYPLECPYPHEQGAINPQTPDEWIKETGHANEMASTEEMMREVEQDTCAVNWQGKVECKDDNSELPWTNTEELLTAPSQPRAKVESHFEVREQSEPQLVPQRSHLLPATAIPACALAGAALTVMLGGRSGKNLLRTLGVAVPHEKEDDDAPVDLAQGPDWRLLSAVVLFMIAAYMVGLLDGWFVAFGLVCSGALVGWSQFAAQQAKERAAADKLNKCCV